MKPNASFGEIADALRGHEKFVVMSHLRPDGDALGCSLAMALCLEELGKRVSVWNEDGLLKKYRFLPRSELVVQPPATPEKFDVAIALDTAAEDRLGTCRAAVGHADLWINIDHHVSNDHFGDLAYIDVQAPATGQILYDFFTAAELPMTYAMADNLFAAISTDTGSFQYPNTSARSFEIAAALIQSGVNVGEISRQLYESYPRRRLDLLRALLNVMKMSCEGRVASFGLTSATVAELGAQPEDNEGLIDYIRAIEGVVVAVFFEELPEGKVRISMRSKDPRADVCKICAQFGGGGHTLAAGARTRGSLPAVEEKVLAAICHELG